MKVSLFEWEEWKLVSNGVLYEEKQGGGRVQSQFSCAWFDKLFVELLHSQSLK